MQIYTKRFSLSMLLILLCVCLFSSCGTGPMGEAPTTLVSATQSSTKTGSTTTNSANTTPTQGDTLPAHSFRSIRMLDQKNGWSLTKNAVLKTGDGGQTWRSVFPSQFTINETTRVSFRDANNAWLAVTVQDVAVVNIIYTHDGGTNWQSSSIKVPNLGGTSTPMFVNNQVGWLEVILSGGAGSFPAYVYQTKNGGLNWTRVDGTDPQKTGFPAGGTKTGLSFKDEQNGWATGSIPSPQPFFYATHDGGKTWQNQKLVAALPGSFQASDVLTFSLTPPVFFGNDGILPVRVSGKYSFKKPDYGLLLLISHDGGKSWQNNVLSESIAPIRGENLYIVNPQHGWVSDNTTNDIYATNDGGQSWMPLGSNIGQITEFSFINNNQGWAIGPNSLHRTNDGGKTWQKISSTIA